MLRLFFLVLLVTGIVHAEMTRQESWIATGGFGLSVGALGQTQVLLTPQLEQVRTPRLYIGPLVQVGISTSSVIGISGTVRYLAGNHAKIRPSFEGGLGMAFATDDPGIFRNSSVGVLIHVGMGVDYQIDSDFSVGTIFRANFAPPMDEFFLTWPVVVARLSL